MESRSCSIRSYEPFLYIMNFLLLGCPLSSVCICVIFAIIISRFSDACAISFINCRFSDRIYHKFSRQFNEHLFILRVFILMNGSLLMMHSAHMYVASRCTPKLPNRYTAKLPFAYFPAFVSVVCSEILSMSFFASFRLHLRVLCSITIHSLHAFLSILDPFHMRFICKSHVK